MSVDLRALKQAFTLKAVNGFFENLLEKQVPELVVRGGVESHDLHGIDIVREIGQAAERSRVVLNEHEEYIHEVYMVYLNPDDYKRLHSLIDEIEKDALDHLDLLKRQKHYLTKEIFSVSFAVKQNLPMGRCAVVSSARIEVHRTILGSVQLPDQEPLQLESRQLEFAAGDLALLQRIFGLLDQGAYETALWDIQEINRRRENFIPGMLLECLLWFNQGNTAAGLRYLNANPVLGESEHGYLLRTLGYLEIGDLERAEELLEKAMLQTSLPVTYFTRGLVALCKGRKRSAWKFMKLAASLEPLFEDLIQTYLFQSTIIRAERASGEDWREPVKAPSYVSLINTTTGQMHHAVFGGSFGFTKPRGAGRLDRRILTHAAAKRVASLRVTCHRDGLVISCTPVEGGRFLLNNRILEAGVGYRLVKGEILRWDHLELHYQAETYTGKWEKGGERNFHIPNQKLWVRDGNGLSETWYFNPVLTFGRGDNLGNDIVLEDKGVSGQGHGELFCRGEEVCFRDLGSTNGSVKNGKKITAVTSLQHGDVLGLAGTSLEVRFGGVYVT